MNTELIKNKTKEIMNAVHSRGEENTEHTPHHKEIELTKEQEHMRLYMLKKGHIIMLNQPFTANTNKNISLQHILIQMKKLSLRVNAKLDKNFDRWGNADTNLNYTDMLTRGLVSKYYPNRVSFWCYFQKAFNNNHIHFYLTLPTKHNLAKVIEVIREQWSKLDTTPDRDKPYSLWHKTLDTDEDVKRYLGYCVREYIVDKDMMKLPKKERFETFEFI